ncbi:SDR family NAD(P)-dependent oxidoreductase [Pseudonocardia endophytica]|uniref:NAD(P)-dependent dehydrogenase (Short-subunit alcohol dehydrogenase family) n=1 Tax=Pseudonocardia endophytica TaxID=401976 RepID=A0A4R1HWI3_PSEEN|nr:SDR family NAD(P)-dependent oxidoreductase [Pseudonocardia endophytica]TCK25120.1 NAD(P)-dependent dehydrogenase (short-subunit alcohol dehydrogenase family) [Pseudonocardia endophytica]
MTTQTEFLSRHLVPRDAAGEVGLVTGGTRGIGKEAARNLVRAGMTVVLAARGETEGRQAAEELSAEGAGSGRAMFLGLDLADPDSVAAAAADIENRLGRLDVLVNNAATAIPPKPAFEVTAAEMRTVYDINVFAVVSLIEAFLPLLGRSPNGRIVNVSSERGSLGVGEGVIADGMRSWAGVEAPPESMAYRVAFVTQPNMAYSTSKAALNAVTQHFAYQFERTGGRIRVNAAAPGHCATAFNNFTGYRTPGQGARIISALALAGDDAPNGGFYGDEGPTTW